MEKLSFWRTLRVMGFSSTLLSEMLLIISYPETNVGVDQAFYLLSELADRLLKGAYYVLQDDENIRNAIMRYEIGHPCVNDGDMDLWRELGISSWPTLAVISPRGRLIATLPGWAHPIWQHIRWPNFAHFTSRQVKHDKWSTALATAHAKCLSASSRAQANPPPAEVLLASKIP